AAGAEGCYHQKSTKEDGGDASTKTFFSVVTAAPRPMVTSTTTAATITNTGTRNDYSNLPAQALHTTTPLATPSDTHRNGLDLVVSPAITPAEHDSLLPGHVEGGGGVGGYRGERGAIGGSEETKMSYSTGGADVNDEDDGGEGGEDEDASADLVLYPGTVGVEEGDGGSDEVADRSHLGEDEGDVADDEILLNSSDGKPVPPSFSSTDLMGMWSRPSKRAGYDNDLSNSSLPLDNIPTFLSHNSAAVENG
ncbi:unnamed protein product, partial [Sphacelaria rigidula]